jgi:D-alanyl-D-alanine carboxypeptidase/D-alanyl-D-alanine-endopeptidase (penicillin-binding protein 4)
MKLFFTWLRFASLLGLLWLTTEVPHEVIAQENPESVIEKLPPTSQVCSANLSSAIAKIINHPKFTRSRWGIEIEVLATGESLYSLNGEKFFTPASTVKLLTTAAVVSELGANYRITTPLYSVGKPPNLTSLRVKGQGDPNISTKSLKAIVHQLQKQGIRRIEKLIIDDSYFAPPTINPTWEWLDVHSYFATAVNSTILNQNTVTLTLLPQQIGKPVKYYWSDVIGRATPESYGLAPQTAIGRSPRSAIAARQWQVINHAITGKANSPYNIEIDGKLGQPVLQIRGQLAVNEPPDVWDLAVVDPAQYFLESLRLYLEQAGIAVNQGVVVKQPYKNKLERELTAITSPPMQEILIEINQESNNLYAEAIAQVLAQKLNTPTAIGRSPRFAIGAATPLAIAAINQSLTKLGINSDEYFLVDASGLSRQNLITPKTLVKTLRIMSRSSQSKFYRHSLAIAGVNGTLKNRFDNTVIEGHLFGKTGTLTGINSLAGYISLPNYPTLVFSIFLNNSQVANQEIKKAIDEIILALYHTNKCSRSQSINNIYLDNKNINN